MQTSSLSSKESGERAADFDAGVMFRRLFVPIDFSDGSKRALATALELQRRFGSEICLFNLTESTGNDEFLAGLGDSIGGRDLVQAAEARLQRFVENLFPGSSSLVACRAHVGTDVVRGIDEGAAQFRASLVVLGVRPHQTLFRTKSEKLIQGITCPVLLVRECTDASEVPH